MSEYESHRRHAVEAMDAGEVERAGELARRAAEVRRAELAGTALQCAYCGESILSYVGGYDGRMRICETCTTLGD